MTTSDHTITRAEFAEEMYRFRDYFREHFATKDDLHEHYVTKADLKEMEIRLMRWTVATVIGGLAAAVGLTAVLIRVLG